MLKVSIGQHKHKYCDVGVKGQRLNVLEIHVNYKCKCDKMITHTSLFYGVVKCLWHLIQPQDAVVE